MNGLISNIQRYSVNDGYGIRTIVFLAGCTMRCAWCQNPETIASGRAHLMFIENSCTGCRACLKECPTGAIGIDGNGGPVCLDRAKCTGCMRCLAACYFGARKASGREMTVDEVFREVMKDETFFRNTGGGLTLSGGEPLMQSAFTGALLRRVKAAGIHTAVETAGHVPAAAIAGALPFVDLFLFDVKLLDEKRHEEMTGVSNRRILDNLALLARAGVEVIVRVPLIPGVNDGREFAAIVKHTAGLGGIKEIHILPYHSIGQSKYAQLDLPFALADLPEENDAEVERCRQTATQAGFRVSVGGTGFARQTA